MGRSRKIPGVPGKIRGSTCGFGPKIRRRNEHDRIKIPASEKRKFALWISKETIEKAKESYKDDNCSSASEFIEKAILFYLGYLSSQENQDYLAQVIPSTVKGIVDESANRMGGCCLRWRWKWRYRKIS